MIQFLMLSLCFFVQNVQAKEKCNLSGEWQGFYSYTDPKRASVNFVASLAQEGIMVKGTTSEPNSLPKNPVKELHADIRGKCLGEDKISFVKIYDGSGGVSHSVDYSGKIDSQCRHINGEWTLMQLKGIFVLDRASMNR